MPSSAIPTNLDQRIEPVPRGTVGGASRAALAGPRKVVLACVRIALGASLIGLGACHRKVEMPPLTEPNISTGDRFFDVWSTSADKAFIVGARGKMLVTEDAGHTFHKIDLGTDVGINAIQMI